MNFSIKPNFREAGKALGKKTSRNSARKLAECDAKKLRLRSSGGSVTMNLGGEDYEIPENYLDVRISAKEGFVVGMENNVFTILETTLTPELIDEGYVREIISKVQQLRKQHDFEMMDTSESIWLRTKRFRMPLTERRNISCLRRWQTRSL